MRENLIETHIKIDLFYQLISRRLESLLNSLTTCTNSKVLSVDFTRTENRTKSINFTTNIFLKLKLLVWSCYCSSNYITCFIESGFALSKLYLQI